MIVAGDLRSAAAAVRTPTEPTTSFTVGSGGVGPGGPPPPKPADPNTSTASQATTSPPPPVSTPVSPVLTGIFGGTTANFTVATPVFGPGFSMDPWASLPDDPSAPTDTDPVILRNVVKFGAYFEGPRVGNMEYVPGTDGNRQGHWLYHGHGTIAREQVLFLEAMDPGSRFYTPLNRHEASIAKATGLTPTEWRMGERLVNLIGTARDPGDAPLGNDGLPIGYGSQTGYGNGGTPTTTPGGQPLGPGGAVDTPTPGPEGHGGTTTSGAKPPVLKKLPTAPTTTNTSKTIAMVALAMGVAYLLLA